MNYIVNLNPWQVLFVAVLSEQDAAEFYSTLKAKVKNSLLLDKIDLLIREEKLHQKMLERLFSQRYPGKPKEVPAGAALPRISGQLDENASVLSLFELALRAEKISEDFYNEAAEAIEAPEARHILSYLGRVERSHQAIIKAEIDLLAQFPDYYKVEDFHLGQDMFHIGP